MADNKALLYGLILFTFAFITPPLLKYTTSLFASAADFPPYTEVLPVPLDPDPTKAAMQMNTFDFITVTPSPIPVEAAPGAGTGIATGGVTGTCGSVIEWAQKLTDALVVGQKGYDKLTAAFNSCGHKAADSTGSFVHYWCTYLIADAYNLAGFKGLSIGSHAAVVNMRSWWKSASGYKYVDGNNLAAIKQVGVGYAVFLESVPGTHTGKEHVFLIKTITVDANGNGSITTLEANAAAKSRTFPIVGGQVKNTSYPVRGFGGR